ncbi:hypothetical protein VIGAN_11104700 [Vigna angularis var. angularis]|uniref:Uncharacterized protein n=1 Tax=Vigna angularis var. angularis TaxID=157739 RepID=A0A0S3T9R5_PHAAN|nr:hypothetical protein VIGAN_11104700 [Vigna angularis var. angularis]
MVLQNDIDLLNPPAELEKRKHKLKRLVQSPNSFFMVQNLLLLLLLSLLLSLLLIFGMENVINFSIYEKALLVNFRLFVAGCQVPRLLQYNNCV